jgi:hypothetical protein
VNERTGKFQGAHGSRLSSQHVPKSQIRISAPLSLSLSPSSVLHGISFVSRDPTAQRVFRARELEIQLRSLPVHAYVRSDNARHEDSGHLLLVRLPVCTVLDRAEVVIAHRAVDQEHCEIDGVKIGDGRGASAGQAP